MRFSVPNLILNVDRMLCFESHILLNVMLLD